MRVVSLLPGATETIVALDGMGLFARPGPRLADSLEALAAAFRDE